MKDYYQDLEIDPDTSIHDIKQQYRKLARKYHPDKNNNSNESTEHFKRLSEAYTVLSNPKKRYFYDIQRRFSLLESFDLSDDDLEILHKYYDKIMKSTEFKLFRCLCKSIPSRYKDKIVQYFKKRQPSNVLIHTKNLKYIDASQLQNNYSVTLTRKLRDVYLNILKQIIIKTNKNYFHIFITHSDYKLQIYNHKTSIITITIQTISKEPFVIHNHNLYYKHTITIYELYYGSKFIITLPDKLQLNCIASDLVHKKQSIITGFGCKNNKNIRGDLIIIYQLDKTNIDPKYKKTLQQIFPIKQNMKLDGIIYRL